MGGQEHGARGEEVQKVKCVADGASLSLSETSVSRGVNSHLSRSVRSFCKPERSYGARFCIKGNDP